MSLAQKKKRRQPASLPTPLFQQRPDSEISKVDEATTALEKSTARLKMLLFIGVTFLVAFQTLASHFFLYGESPRSFEEEDEQIDQGYGIPHSLKSWPQLSWKTENFTTSELKYQKTGYTAPGYLFYGVEAYDIQQSAPVIMKEDGELIFQGRISENASNLRLQMIDGESYLTTWTGTIVGNVGRGYGSVHIYDHSYKEVFSFCDQVPPLTTLDDSQYPCYIDTHESKVTPKGTLLVTAYNITRADLSTVGGDPEGWIVDCLFYEIDIVSGHVVFQWSSLDHLDSIPITQSHKFVNLTSPTSGSSQRDAWDYFHINSVSPLDDGYLVNARHTWSFYKISRNGSIEWRVEGDPSHGGDFKLEPNVSFKWQHNTRARRVSPSEIQLSLFDNHNSNFLPASSPSPGLLLLINEETRRVSLIRRLDDEDDQIISQSQGNYHSMDESQPLDSHVIVGYGSIPAFKEFDGSGNQVYKGQFDSYNGTSDTYRAYRFEWVAEPYWKPEAYSEVVDGQIHVWTSWNGATEYDSWSILAGDSDDQAALREVAIGARDGFETEFILGSGSSTYVQAIALKGREELSKSEIVPVQR